MWIILLLSLLAPQSQQAPVPAGSFPLGSVHVTGNQRYTVAQVQGLSGLVIGQSVTIADLDATLKQMSETGLFSKVGYRYGPDENDRSRLAVTYEIEEPEWKMPVLFDNFVWFTDAELEAAVAAAVPTFDGTLPLTDGAQNLVIRSLESFLKQRGFDREVAFALHNNIQTKASKFVFRAVDPSLRVCAVRLDGASPAWQKRLAPAVAAQVGREYSRASLEGFVIGEVRDTYRGRGHLAGEVGAPVAKLDDGCTGVSLSLPVTEGDEYKWDRVTWSGNSSIQTNALDRLLAMRPGSVAETLALDEGLSAVQDAYGKIGHVQAKVTYTARTDPSTTRAALEMQVDEGAQFRMGVLQLVGLSDADAADLTKRWKLKPGDVFDSSYAAEFQRTHIRPLQQRRQLAVRGPAMTGDPASRTVNVRFEFRASETSWSAFQTTQGGTEARRVPRR